MYESLLRNGSEKVLFGSFIGTRETETEFVASVTGIREKNGLLAAEVELDGPSGTKERFTWLFETKKQLTAQVEECYSMLVRLGLFYQELLGMLQSGTRVDVASSKLDNTVEMERKLALLNELFRKTAEVEKNQRRMNDELSDKINELLCLFCGDGR